MPTSARKRFEVRHVQVDVTTERGKGYFLVGDDVEIDFPDSRSTTSRTVVYFKQKENFQRIYVRLNEPAIVRHVGSAYEDKKK